MSKFQRFEDLDIWKIAVSIAVNVYILCDSEPLKSDWGMKDQIRRAACSMSDNIAEGFEYKTTLILSDFSTMQKDHQASLGISSLFYI